MATNITVLSRGPCWEYKNLSAKLQTHTVQKAEVLMVAAAVVMFCFVTIRVAGRLFGNGLPAEHPFRRVLFWAFLSLFLPLTSYMFSQAQKATGGQELSAPNILPPRAQLILVWMLLVELIRKKLDAILGNTAASGTGGLRNIHGLKMRDVVDQVVRVAWVGYFVIFHVHHPKSRVVFFVLWFLVIFRVAQRVYVVCRGQCSFAVGRNAHLIAGYMTQVLLQEEREEVAGPDAPLKTCRYAVMGEETVPRVAEADGYRLKVAEEKGDLVTVGNIWTLASVDDDPRLKRLCLSFALFKLLRLRLENYPVDEACAGESGVLILRSLNATTDKKAEIFQLFEDELRFLSEYYRSVEPLVLFTPQSYFLNSLLGLCFLGIFFLLTLAFNAGILKCMFYLILNQRVLLFSLLDLSLSILLLLGLAALELSEPSVYALSHWFTVWLLCSYARQPQWQWLLHAVLGFKLRLKELMQKVLQLLTPSKLKPLIWAHLGVEMWFKQFSVLAAVDHCHPLLSKTVQRCLPGFGVPFVLVPEEVKKAVVEAVVEAVKACDGITPLSMGVSALQHSGCARLRWACESKSAAEVILVWHLATSLYELQHPLERKEKPSAERTVATTLSKYCAYLVAFSPELLPDDPAGTERAYKGMKRALRRVLRAPAARRGKYETVIDMAGLEGAAEKGAKLATQLLEEAADMWKVLAGVWTEMVIYVAPSDNVEAHARVLLQGGELITVLWAIATHAGIRRSGTDAAASSTPAGEVGTSSALGYQPSS